MKGGSASGSRTPEHRPPIEPLLFVPSGVRAPPRPALLAPGGGVRPYGISRRTPTPPPDGPCAAGLILERKGRAIAETQGSFDLVCSPVDVMEIDAEIGLLAEIVEFDVDDDTVLDKIRSAKRSNPFSAITVARDLRFEQVSVIEFNRENLPGFSVQVQAKRSYPYGTAFAHVLGYVGEASPEELDRSEDDSLAMGDLVGKYGLERRMDDDLRGVNGGRKVEVDAAGRDQRLVEEVPSRVGGAVHTSLDVDLQVTAQEALGNRAGAVIAIAPRTGEVLAFYSGPAFDPNVFARGIRKADWQALSADTRKPMQKKASRARTPRAPPSAVPRDDGPRGEDAGERGNVLCPGSYRLGTGSSAVGGEGARRRRHVPGDRAVVRRLLLHARVELDPTGGETGEGRGAGDDHGDRPPRERKGWSRTRQEADREQGTVEDYESVLLGIGQGSATSLLSR